MKFLLGLLMASVVTVAWQSSAHSDAAAPTGSAAIDRIEQESRQAGRTPIQEGDCD